MHLKVEGGGSEQSRTRAGQRCLTGSVLPSPVPWAQEKLSREEDQESLTHVYLLSRHREAEETSGSCLGSGSLLTLHSQG